MFSFLYDKVYEKVFYYKYECFHCGKKFRSKYLEQAPETIFCKMACGLNHYAVDVTIGMNTEERIQKNEEYKKERAEEKRKEEEIERIKILERKRNFEREKRRLKGEKKEES